MITKKSGTILINLKTKKIGLVYRKKKNDYSFPKGHLEKGETLAECAIRETKEETDLDIADLEVFNVVDDIQPNKHYITIQIIANKFEGELKNLEPTKHSEWKWFELNNLPQNLYTPTKEFIEKYLERDHKKKR